MPETLNITDFILHGNGILILKIPLVILMLLYAMFLFIVINRIKALNRTMAVQEASKTIQTVARVQFLLAIALLLVTLFIV